MEIFDHDYHRERGVYAVLVGERREHDALVEGQRGPLLDHAGQPVYRRELLGHTHVREIVFAADDPRWEGKSADQVREEQCAIVSDALNL